MRKLFSKSAILILLSIFLISNLQASDNKITNSNIDYEKVEQSLLMGLNSDNIGLTVSSACMLGEIKSENAVIPLTKLLRDGKDERIRLAAALSLIKIGTEKSIYFVKQGEKFNKLQKVRQLCHNLYNAHVANTFNGVEPDKETLFSYLYKAQ